MITQKEFEKAWEDLWKGYNYEPKDFILYTSLDNYKTLRRKLEQIFKDEKNKDNK